MNLTPDQVSTIRFAAAVIEAEIGGRRKSQAAAELRAMLPKLLEAAESPAGAGGVRGIKPDRERRSWRPFWRHLDAGGRL